MRVIKLTAEFYRSRKNHVRPGSPAEKAVKRTIQRLAIERHPLPAPGDREELRTPIGVTFARPVQGTELVLI